METVNGLSSYGQYGLMSHISEQKQEFLYHNMISELDLNSKYQTLYSSMLNLKDPYYGISRFRSYMERIKGTKNERFIVDFIYNQMIIKSKRLHTGLKYLAILIKYQSVFDFNNINSKSVFELFIAIKTDSTLSQATKASNWKKLKVIIRFLGFPYDLSQLYMQEPRNAIKPHQLITRAEFELIGAEMERHQYGRGLEFKAFLYLLADTGCRTSEAFSVNRWTLIKNESAYYEAIIEGKGGNTRTIVLTNSTPLFEILIKSGWKTWTFNYYAFYRQLTRVCARIGITKRVYNHLFRHGFGSFIAEDASLSIEVKNKYCGWSPESKMLETTYAHFDQKRIMKLMMPALSRNPYFKGVSS